MNIEKELSARSDNKCELCNAATDLQVYSVPPVKQLISSNSILVCSTCFEQLNDEEKITPNHWRCLNDSMWSTVPAVQVVAWRMLNKLRAEGWPIDLLDMLYLDDETMEWAKSTGEGIAAEDVIRHVDSNGVVLEQGDSVVLIKNLDVKGGNFTAKRGTAVRNINLVADNAEHIEGRVNDQQIVILTKYVRKTN